MLFLLYGHITNTKEKKNMKKKFLLYVSSLVYLSLSATQVSNAMQSDNYGKTVDMTVITLGGHKVQISFKFDHGFNQDRAHPPVKYQMAHPINGRMAYFLIKQEQAGLIKRWNFTSLTEAEYNQTDALLAEVVGVEAAITN